MLQPGDKAGQLKERRKCMESERIKYLNGMEQVLGFTRRTDGRYMVTSRVYGADGYYRANLSTTRNALTVDEIDWLVDRLCEGRNGLLTTPDDYLGIED
jgi:hypothetical protein